MNRFLGVLALLAVSLAVLAWLILGQGIGEPLVPPPEKVVQNFVVQLAGKRYERALENLGDELKAEYDQQGLAELDKRLTEKQKGYEFELGGETQETSDEATYVARIKFEEGGEQNISFELERSQETGLWEISSLEGLEQASQ